MDLHIEADPNPRQPSRDTSTAAGGEPASGEIVQVEVNR
jgi:hypothetical protein